MDSVEVRVLSADPRELRRFGTVDIVNFSHSHGDFDTALS